MERWLPVVGFDLYDISNKGRVRSWVQKGPGSHRLSVPKLMQPCRRGAKSPYLRVTLTLDGVKFSKPIHVILTEAFHGPRPLGKWALHRDGNLLNNTDENLRWGTPVDNADDRTKHGRTMFGESNHKTPLTASDVVRIRRSYQDGTANQVDLAETYGISQSSISAIILRKSWSHV